MTKLPAVFLLLISGTFVVPTDTQAATSTLWSLRPLSRPAVPNVEQTTWAANPIDFFILHELEKQGLQPSVQATYSQRVRRLALDLLGLPPTEPHLLSLGSKPGPSAYPALVDRFLASPHYGERWARHWLDVARFAESSGFEHDSDRPTAYPYRDFVIHALNRNLPYSSFLQWQLAGDLLHPNQYESAAATGFLGAGVFPTQLTEKEFESARYDELDDMVATTGSAMLGLSIGCARCHDHKFDPISATDYYRFAAHFTQTIRSEIELTGDDGKLIKTMVSTEGQPPMKHAADGRGFPHFYAQTHFLKRGDSDKKGDVAEPGYPAAFGSAEPTEAENTPPRVALAQWITDPINGAGALSARVIVNRLWQHHLGQGLVRTSNDFGTQGTPPTHPELLEWLAAELVARDWDLKAIHRLIVTSSTYQQASLPRDDAQTIDPDDRLLWRFPPRRLEAEPIRDAMLMLSDSLDLTPFGPGSLDNEMPRRSIYFFIKRSRLIPFLLLFDFPEPMVSIGHRATTNIAPQGLALMNSPTIRRYAIALANRVRTHELTPRSQIQRLYEWVYSRPPTEAEQAESQTFLSAQTQRYTPPNPKSALADLCHSLFMSNEFLYLN